MLARLRAALPPAMVVLVALTVVAAPALRLSQAHLATAADRLAMRDQATALSLAGLGWWLLSSLLIGVTYLELGRRRRGADRALLWVAAGVGLTAMVQPLVSAWFGYVDQPSLSTLREYYRWTSRIWFVLWVGGAGCVAAALARRGGAAAAVGAALVVVTALAHPLEAISDRLWPAPTPANAWTTAALELAITSVGTALHLGAAYLLGKDAPASTGTPGQLLIGLERVGTALVVRVLAALGTGLFTMMAIGAKSPGLMKVVVTVVPLVLIGSLVAQVSGLFTAAGDAAGPRLRLTAAGALTAFVTVVTSVQAVALFRVARDRWSHGELDSWEVSRLTAAAHALPYLTPAVLLIGLGLLLSAVAAARRPRPDLEPTTVTSTALLVVGGTLAALWLGRHAERHLGTPGEFLLLTVLVAACNVAALLALARLCHKTVWALRLGSDGLPPARVVDGNPM